MAIIHTSLNSTGNKHLLSSDEMIRSDIFPRSLSRSPPLSSCSLGRLSSGPGARLSLLASSSRDARCSCFPEPRRLLSLFPHLAGSPSSTSLLGPTSLKTFFSYPHLGVLWLDTEFKMKIVSCCHLEVTDRLPFCSHGAAHLGAWLGKTHISSSGRFLDLCPLLCSFWSCSSFGGPPSLLF